MASLTALWCVALFLSSCRASEWRQVALPGEGAERLAGWWFDAFEGEPVMWIGRRSSGWVLRAPARLEVVSALVADDRLELTIPANGQLVTVALFVSAAENPASAEFDLYFPMGCSGAWVHDPSGRTRLEASRERLRRIMQRFHDRLVDALLDVL